MDSTTMTVCFVLFVSFVGKVTSSAMEVPTMQEYSKCAETINKQLPWNNCQETIDASVACTTSLARRIKACPDGKTAIDPICNLMLTTLIVEPMAYASGSTEHLSICRLISHLTQCKKECLTDFVVPDRNNTGLPCSVRAAKDCSVGLGTNNQQAYDKNDCSELTVERECYVRKLMKCGGTDTQQLAADLMFIGLDNHLKKCKETETLCSNVEVPDFIPKLDSMITKDSCKIMHNTGVNLDNCLAEHSHNTTDSVMIRVKNTIADVNETRQLCDKKGYTIESTNKDPNYASIIQQPTMTIIIFSLIALFH